MFVLYNEKRGLGYHAPIECMQISSMFDIFFFGKWEYFTETYGPKHMHFFLLQNSSSCFFKYFICHVIIVKYPFIIILFIYDIFIRQNVSSKHLLKFAFDDQAFGEMPY